MTLQSFGVSASVTQSRDLLEFWEDPSGRFRFSLVVADAYASSGGGGISCAVCSDLFFRPNLRRIGAKTRMTAISVSSGTYVGKFSQKTDVGGGTVPSDSILYGMPAGSWTVWPYIPL